MMKLQKFCCCCTVRTGTLIIGTAGWLFTLMYAIALGARADAGPALPEDEPFARGQHNNKYISIGGAIISLGVCIALVVGVYKNNKHFMLPWLVLKCLEIIGLVIGLILCIAALFMSTQPGPFLVIVFVLLLVTVLSVYCFLCVLTHYQNLGETANRTLMVPTEEMPPNYPDMYYKAP